MYVGLGLWKMNSFLTGLIGGPIALPLPFLGHVVTFSQLIDLFIQRGRNKTATPSFQGGVMALLCVPLPTNTLLHSLFGSPS